MLLGEVICDSIPRVFTGCCSHRYPLPSTHQNSRLPEGKQVFCTNLIVCVPLQFSHSVVSDSLQPHELQHSRLTYPSPTLELAQTHVPRVGDAIKPFHPLLSSSPAFNPSQHKGLFQHHSSKVSSLRHSAFFIVQLSHPYMTTGKTIALTTQTFVGKVMSLLFNMLSRLVIAFLPRLSDFHFTFIHISNRNSQMLLERQ